MNDSPNVFHLAVISKLKDKYQNGIEEVIVDRRAVCKVLCQSFRLPKLYHTIFLKQMETFGMIKRISQQKVKICNQKRKKSYKYEPESWF